MPVYAIPENTDKPAGLRVGTICDQWCGIALDRLRSSDFFDEATRIASIDSQARAMKTQA